jgi:hypothetical protein
VRDSRYHHRKYTIVWSISWELHIDPVTDPPEPESHRYDDSESIDESPEWVLIPLCKKKHSQYGSKESSMEAHSTFPDFDHLNRMFHKK